MRATALNFCMEVALAFLLSHLHHLLAAEPSAVPWQRTVYQIWAELDVKWGLNFLSLFLPNYESYSIEILYEGSPCITLGHGVNCGALAAYYLLNSGSLFTKEHLWNQVLNQMWLLPATEKNEIIRW